MLIVFNLVLSFVLSNVSVGGHIGGLVGGIIGGLASPPGERRRQRVDRLGRARSAWRSSPSSAPRWPRAAAAPASGI